jgi:predicted NBD/HSP70 family sugar kinase
MNANLSAGRSARIRRTPVALSRHRVLPLSHGVIVMSGSNAGDSGADTKYRAKDREKEDVFRAIGRRTDATRKTLAETLGIRPSSVCAIVQELIDDRLVAEGDVKKQGVPGRPELLLRINRSRFVTIALYVESRELRGALVGMDEVVLAEKSVSVPAEASGALFLRCSADLVRQLRGQVPQGSELLGAAISLVGTVDPSRKRWISSARWPNIRDVDLVALETSQKISLSVRRSLDTVLEHQLTKRTEYAAGNTLLFHWGFGIGSAYAHHGVVLDSTIGRFGEIGHTTVDLHSEKRCLCGSRGCLETEAALWAILPAIREVHPEVSQEERAFGRLVADDPSVLQHPVVQRAMVYVKEGLLNLHKVLYPDWILLIGPFTGAQSISDEILRYLQANLPGYERGSVQMEVIHEDFRGCMHGSAYPFFRQKLTDVLRSRF